MNARVALLAAALPLALAACSPGESVIETMIENEAGVKDAQVNADGSVRIETNEGTFTSGEKLPDDWPSDMPIPDEARIMFAATSDAQGSNGMVLTLSSKESVSAIADFYKEAIADNGWTIETTMTMNGSTMLAGVKDVRAFSLMVGPGTAGETSITLGITER